MIHEILPVGMLQCNCSILGDETTKEAVVVDPGDNIPQIQAVLARHGLTVKAIVITHAHIDHIGGAEILKQATGAPVYMNENDAVLRDHMEMQAAWLNMRAPEVPEVEALNDGDTLHVGATTLHVLHTPGHTQGSVCLWIPQENRLLAGDTLFLEGVGRTDLPGGDERQLLRSIAGKLLVLPEDAGVVPGHGDNTTIAHEKRFNGFLRGL